MSDLRELYQEMILEHSRSPRNFGPIENQNLSARGYNPLCGDEVEIFLHRDSAGILQEIAFEGCGCAISTASASILTEVLKGRSEAEVREIFSEFHQMVAGEGIPPSRDGLVKLKVFGGVKEFPSRVKCATLVWHTLIQALDEQDGEVCTE